MKFNYGYEKRKFDEEWKKLRKEYEAAGMDADAIDEMYRFDLDAFRAERVYCRHTHLMKSFSLAEGHDEGDDAGKAYGKNRIEEKLSVEMPLTDPDRRYGWIDELDDEELVRAIRRLDNEELDLITNLSIEGLSQVEIANGRGVTKQTVNEKWQKIRKKLKKVSEST